MQISTLYMTQLQIQLPVTIHSTTSRNKQLTNGMNNNILNI